jgi:nitrite reductase/ring-hydroxylating ferredoxin subunit
MAVRRVGLVHSRKWLRDRLVCVVVERAANIGTSAASPRPLGATAAAVGGFSAAATRVEASASTRHSIPAVHLDAHRSGSQCLTEAVRVDADGVPVLPSAGQILAVAATCPHRGAPLEEGSFDAETVTCPWHGSCFALGDGALLRGPSAMPLPRYETRVKDGTVEVRAFTE